MVESTTNILHILEHVEVGGIRTKLLHMLKEYPDPDIHHVILTFDGTPGLTDEFNALSNATVKCAPETADWSLLGGAFRTLTISNAIKDHAPSLVHSWHMSTNMDLLPIAPFIGNTPILLSIDCPSVVADKKTPLTNIRLRALSALSLAENVHIHSISARTTDELVKAGMRQDSVIELGNGVDTDHFQPIQDAKKDVCREFGLPEDAIIIGGAGRHSKADPSKDIPNVLYAAAALKQKNPDLYAKCVFMVCGKGTADGELHEISRTLGVDDKTLILGARNDMPRLYSSWDISNICSLYEPFGLVLPEAMACETICVATNVDMLPGILSGHGIIVEPRDAEARANAWERILSIEPGMREMIATSARKHVERYYNNRVVNAEYAFLYRSLAEQGREQRQGRGMLPEYSYA